MWIKKINSKKKVGEYHYGIIIIHSQGYEILCNVKLIDSLLYLITELKAGRNPKYQNPSHSSHREEPHLLRDSPRITQLDLNKNATRTTVSPNKVYVQMEYLIKDKIQSQKSTALYF